MWVLPPDERHFHVPVLFVKTHPLLYGFVSKPSEKITVCVPPEPPLPGLVTEPPGTCGELVRGTILTVFAWNDVHEIVC